jgi:hypothetical protein
VDYNEQGLKKEESLRREIKERLFGNKAAQDLLANQMLIH